MLNEKIINSVAQVAIPVLTIGGQLAIGLKYPAWGLVLCLLAQPFWLYSTWKAYKNAGQIGLLINTILFTLVTLFGVINYWLV
jgi:hypothetical protein